MTIVKSAVLATLLALAPVAAFAEELPDDVREAVTTRVDAFNDVMTAGDMSATFDFVPAKLFASMAAQAGVPQDQFMEIVKSQIDETMAMVTIDGFSMDVDAATYETTPDGSRPYVLIPTETVMTVEGAGKMRSTGNTLALEDEGVWYLININDPNLAQFLAGAYPEFADVAFEPGVIEPVAE